MRIFLLMILACFFSELISETPSTLPGEYATIDEKNSREAVRILMSDKYSLAERSRTANLVQAEPGNYTPWALLALGLYRLSQNHLNDAALFLRAAVFRIIVDTKISQDPDVDNVIEIAFDLIREYTETYIDTPQKKKAWAEALAQASKELEHWDRVTPRNYDARWISLHGTGVFSGKPLKKTTPEQKEAIIEEENRLFRENAPINE